MISKKRQEDAERQRFSGAAKNQNNQQANDNYEQEILSPCTVKCLSTQGEVYKISATEFHRKIFKEPRTIKQLITNLDKKL